MTKLRNIRFQKAFGEQVRKLRDQRKLSQEELYDLAGISKNEIGNIERGDVNTTISTVYALAKALQVDVKALFDFDFQG